MKINSILSYQNPKLNFKGYDYYNFREVDPNTVKRGSGSWVWDDQDKKYRYLVPVHHMSQDEFELRRAEYQRKIDDDFYEGNTSSDYLI